MSAADVVRTFWEGVDGRDWEAVGAALAEDVLYEVPQTGERVRGRDAVVRFNAEYPGDWNLSVTTLVADAHQAATTIRFVLPGEPDQTGIAFFRLDDAGPHRPHGRLVARALRPPARPRPPRRTHLTASATEGTQERLLVGHASRPPGGQVSCAAGVARARRRAHRNQWRDRWHTRSGS